MCFWITTTNASWGSQPQMIEIERLQAQVRRLPLLFRDVELKHIGLVGVDVLLETDLTGQGNWDFSVDDSSARKSGAFKLHNLDIDKIRIENLSFAFRKGKTGSETRFKLASLDVARQGADDALTLNLRADYNGQPVELSGEVGLIRRLFAYERFPLKLSGKFSNAAVKIEGAIDDVLDLHGIDLMAYASGTNLAALGRGMGIKLPKTSAFDVTGHLNSRTVISASINSKPRTKKRKFREIFISTMAHRPMRPLIFSFKTSTWAVFSKKPE